MQRILLARPNSHTRDAIAFFPPLGILYLSAVVKEKTDHVVSVFDEWNPSGMLGRFEKRLTEFSPTVVGLSAMAPSAELMHALARSAKRYDPSILVVAGGAHATACPEDCLADMNIDMAVLHEGERTFINILATREAGNDFNSVAGLAIREPDGKMIRTPPADFIDRLDELPYPDWDQIDLPFYLKRQAMASVGPGRSMPLFTTRGCPFGCIFCHNVMGKRHRARSPQNVLDEIAWMQERYDIRAVEFVDDTFNYDREWALSVLEGIASRGWPRKLKLRFPNGLHADRLDEEMIDMFKAAGTDYLVLAIESGSERIQRLIKKRVNLKRADHLIRYAARRDLFVAGFFMVGFPTETEADLKATYDFAVRSALHQAMFFITIPFTGTELHRKYCTGCRCPPVHSGQVYNRSACNLSDVPDERFFAMHRRAFIRFYASPKRLWRLFRAYPNRRALPAYLPFMLRRMFDRSQRPGTVQLS